MDSTIRFERISTGSNPVRGTVKGNSSRNDYGNEENYEGWN